MELVHKHAVILDLNKMIELMHPIQKRKKNYEEKSLYSFGKNISREYLAPLVKTMFTSFLHSNSCSICLLLAIHICLSVIGD